MMNHNIITAVILFFVLHSAAQPASYNFRHLTTSEGLSDGVVRGIGQDKYGFMWFGSVNGLTVYNGYSAKVIEADAKNPFAYKDNSITALCKDRNGTMWLAQPSGIYQYEYATGRFHLQPGTADLSTTKLYTTGDTFLYIGTKRGLKIYDVETKRMRPASTDAITLLLLDRSVRDISSNESNLLYLATDTGIVLYNAPQQTATLVQARSQPAYDPALVAIDKKGRLWCSDGESVCRVDGNYEVVNYARFTIPKQPVAENRINDLFVDSKGRIWVATSRTGLCLYSEAADKFTAFVNDPAQSQTLSTNIVSSIFQSDDGTIWIGTEGYGLNYFNPDKTFFHTLLPSFHQSPALPDDWCRGAAEDQQGHWWLATATGLAVYNPTDNSYKVFQNRDGSAKALSVNSIRAVLCAGDGTVWIGTADGLNRYHPQTGRMDFYDLKEGVPSSFFWHIAEDRHHKIWIGCRDGIYSYDPATNAFDNTSTNKLLAPYCRFRTRSIFIDRENRIWFGFDGKGLLLYDEQRGLTKHWRKKDGDSTTISGDFITSVTEDKTGTIWIGTISGLNAYKASVGAFHQYYKSSGLPSNNIAALMVDDDNRLWMGTGRGLCLWDNNHNYFKTFSTEDGLVSEEFNDQSACKMRSGVFVYPTFKGFLYFNPASYHPQRSTSHTYLTAFRVYNKDFPLNTNPENVKNINLKWDQSFFSFTVAAPGYTQAQQTTYAYWLEPFDKGWIYTKERTRNYTNVPGGRYVMHFKATADPQDWNVPEERITITIGTVFYKTWWFIAAITLLFLLAVYWVYHYRLRQHQQVMTLQARATALEKEKMLALYESLKQQLNPHFLFNSLSSLSGLIQKDQQAARIFLDQLSKIYRYVLKSGESESVRISEDLKLAQVYVKLQQTRFGQGLQLVVDLDEEAMNLRIAPVTIQNLIENAIKHNIIDPETPLIISITATENDLVLRNNLQRKSFVEGSNKQGLHQMKTLYRYLCGRPVITEETASFFTVKIPFV